MSSGLSVALPLTVDNVFGNYRLNTTFEQIAKQNLKMLVLTIPGERIMDPGFGVGIQQYLFSLPTSDWYASISNGINEQVQKYLNYLDIDDIEYFVPEDNGDLFPHSMAMAIHFTIVPLQLSTVLQIQVDNY